MKPLANANEGRTVNGALGIVVEAAGGRTFDFSALASPPGSPHALQRGASFAPRDESYEFSFDYDPQAGNGFGQISFSLDGKNERTLKLTREQQQARPTFDRFGVVSRRVNGMHMVMYFDDLTYMARRPKGWKQRRHEQQIIAVPYPKGGREY